MSDSATDATRDSYYGRPILKAPVWKWEIPVYFFFGGMAGAAAPFALLSELRGDEALERRAWLVAMAGAAASPRSWSLTSAGPSAFTTCCACSSRPRR